MLQFFFKEKNNKNSILLQSWQCTTLPSIDNVGNADLITSEGLINVPIIIMTANVTDNKQIWLNSPLCNPKIQHNLKIIYIYTKKKKKQI